MIGIPAVGKSTVGLILATEIGLGFQDTDILIQTNEKMTLAEIIHSNGIRAFLDVEGKYTESLDCNNQIIATGGSVIYRESAMAHLAKISTIVYLVVDLSVLVNRLSDLVSRWVDIDPGRGIDDRL